MLDLVNKEWFYFSVGVSVGAFLNKLWRNRRRWLLRSRIKRKSDDDHKYDENIIQKLVLCVRRDIKKTMGNGKMAAQCAHAAVGACMQMPPSQFEAYELQGQPKIVVGVKNEEELYELERKARLRNVPALVIIDQGRTRLPPNTSTVLAVGPAAVEDVDAITSHLKLL